MDIMGFIKIDTKVREGLVWMHAKLSMVTQGISYCDPIEL